MPDNIRFPVFRDGKYHEELHPGFDVKGNPDADLDMGPRATGVPEFDNRILKSVLAKSGFTKQDTTKPNPRQVANRKIVKILAEEVEKHPDQRFWQLLFNLGIVNTASNEDGSRYVVDEYGVESTMILNKILNKVYP